MTFGDFIQPTKAKYLVGFNGQQYQQVCVQPEMLLTTVAWAQRSTNEGDGDYRRT